MKKSLLFTALLAATPLALLLPGCSGGATGLGSLFPTPTPKPGATATPVPGVSRTSNFTLGNRQRVILKTVQNGTALTGTCQILAPLATSQTRTAQVLTTPLVLGTFPINGTLIGTREFRLTVLNNLQTLFTLAGLFDVPTEIGNYILTANGQTDSGTIPIGGATPTATPSTTATPAPTSPPVGGPYKLVSNLTISAVTPDCPVIRDPLTTYNDLSEGGSITDLAGPPASQSLRVGGTSNSRTFIVGFGGAPNLQSSPQPFKVGQVITLTFFNVLQYTQPFSEGGQTWRTSAGTCKITALGADSITIEVTNARFSPVALFGSVGSFTVNGTLTATGLTRKSG